MPIFTLKVGGESHHERLDVYLTRTLADVPSRSFIKKLLSSQAIMVNGRCVKAHYKVQEGDDVRVEIPEDFLLPARIEPENIPLDIFYEDDFLLVVHKPSGMVVHPSQGCYSGTLVNALLYHIQRLSDVNTLLRPGIVHRLDRETSGLMVVAKDNKTHEHLARQFQEHAVKKHYTALVAGEVEFDEGIVDAPLGAHLYSREKRSVLYEESAKDAVTFYRVLRRHRGVTLIDLFPKTGRTHQLRVHMSHIGHPILGDDKYGRKGSFPRLALHACGIGFTHPAYRSWMEFSSRPPTEFLEKVD